MFFAHFGWQQPLHLKDPKPAGTSLGAHHDVEDHTVFHHDGLQQQLMGIVCGLVAQCIHLLVGFPAGGQQLRLPFIRTWLQQDRRAAETLPTSSARCRAGGTCLGCTERSRRRSRSLGVDVSLREGIPRCLPGFDCRAGFYFLRAGPSCLPASHRVPTLEQEGHNHPLLSRKRQQRPRLGDDALPCLAPLGSPARDRAVSGGGGVRLSSCLS